MRENGGGTSGPIGGSEKLFHEEAISVSLVWRGEQIENGSYLEIAAVPRFSEGYTYVLAECLRREQKRVGKNPCEPDGVTRGKPFLPSQQTYDDMRLLSPAMAPAFQDGARGSLYRSV